MSNSVDPVEIEFALKNLNFKAESEKMKAEISGVSLTAEQAAARIKAALSDTNVKYNQAALGVNQYAKSVTSLNFSMQQVARELPSLAISPQMFFLAISNNLPILADNLKRVREENKLLSATGQASTPVWKQMISSIFSWQTALIAGITVLTVWGKDIFNGISNLFKFRNEIRLSTEELDKLNESFAKNAGSEVGKLNYLFDTLSKAKEGTIEYMDAKQEILKQYGSYLKGMDNEITSLNNVKGAYDALNKAIYENAKNKALKSTYEELGQNLVTETQKQLGNIYDQLIAKHGKNAGSAFFDQIKTELESGKGLSYSMQRVVDDFKKKVYTSQGTSITGSVQGAALIEINELNDAVKAYTKAQSEFENKITDARRILETKTLGSTPQVKSLLDIQQGLLQQAKLMPEATEAEIKAKNKKVEAIENEIKRLQELGKTNKKAKGIESEIKEVEEKLMNATGKELDYLAAKLVLLQTELELRQKISNAAVLKEKDPETEKVVQANNPITPKGISSLIKVGSLKTEEDKDTGKKILYEVTAIDKTGPVYTKVKGEIGKLNKYEKDLNKEASKEQEDLIEEMYKKRKQDEEDLRNYSRQFTSELINQLGLTQEQSKELNGIADTIYNLASGNTIGAIFSAASTVLSAIFSGSGKEDPTAKALENVNNLLEHQSAILSNLSGSNYFQLAQKQYLDLGKAIDLNNKKLQESKILTDEEMSKARASFPAKAQQIFELTGKTLDFNTYVKGLKSVTDNWSPEQFIEAYTKGSIKLDEQQISWINGIVESQKQRAELLQETFRQALGFDSTNVADSIFQGIEDGLKLSENGLGGFAKTFGELMKEALMKSVTDTMEMDITNTFLPEYKKAMSDGILTEDERKQLETLYVGLVRQGQIDADNIKTITGQYLGSSASNYASGLTGSVKGASEETTAALVGQLMAVRVDVKELIKYAAMGQDDVSKSLLYLRQISDNTSYNKELIPISKKLENIENVLRSRL